MAGWGARLDPFWRPAVVEAGRRGASWCVLFNGTHVRLVNARRLYSRRYVELDLDLAVDDERTCAVLLLLFGEPSQSAGSASGGARRGVRSARVGRLSFPPRRRPSGICQRARRAHAPVRRRTSLDDAFEQALTIVYRILFLLFAEARHLVPVWHPVYRESYSLDALRAAAETDRASPGLWDALRAVSRLAHAGCRAGDLVVTPFNGRLFAPAKTPLAERRDLDDACGA